MTRRQRNAKLQASGFFGRLRRALVAVQNRLEKVLEIAETAAMALSGASGFDMKAALLGTLVGGVQEKARAATAIRQQVRWCARQPGESA